jgi:hypothetical protein
MKPAQTTHGASALAHEDLTDRPRGGSGLSVVDAIPSRSAALLVVIARALLRSPPLDRSGFNRQDASLQLMSINSPHGFNTQNEHRIPGGPALLALSLCGSSKVAWMSCKAPPCPDAQTH